MTHSTEIVGYTYAADNYCVGCIIDVMPFGAGEQFDGWKLWENDNMPTEDNLTELAHAFGFERRDETTFDSSEFPKIIFSSQCEGSEYCGACYAPIGE